MFHDILQNLNIENFNHILYFPALIMFRLMKVLKETFHRYEDNSGTITIDKVRQLLVDMNWNGVDVVLAECLSFLKKKSGDSLEFDEVNFDSRIFLFFIVSC